MKKILIILFSFLGFGFIACLIIGFVTKPGVELLPAGVTPYKFHTGIILFTKVLPTMIYSGFVLSCSIQFGHHSEGSSQRFSQTMFKRYQKIIMISVTCSFILALSSEVLALNSKRRKSTLENQPKLVKDYVRAGSNFLEQGKILSAAAYAKEALELDKANKEAANIKNQADIILNMQETKSARILYESNLDELFTDTSSDIDTKNLSEAYGLYLKAKSCWDKEEYFMAHYYAESAIKISSGKNPNLQELKELSSNAWNKLSELHELARSEDQKLFMEKYSGYKALMEEDYLKAYYILKTIQIEHPELKNDTDLYFYEGIAEKKVNERSFFTDETWNLKSFESANDIYFSLKYDDGWTDIIYFKGMTKVKTTGGMVQYLRDFSIQSINPEGNFSSSMRVPYAKVLMVSVKDINPLTKDNLGIPRNVNYVPYILLKSIDRENEGTLVKPVYNFADDEGKTGADYIMLPMEFTDFQMVEDATLNPESIPITSLFKVISKAENFGYSEEVYGQVLLNRLLYPLFLLMLFLILATIAWNNRLEANKYFRTSWVFVFPIFTIIGQFLNQISLFLFKLGNYACLGIAGPRSAIFCGLGIYVVLIFGFSILFLSRKAD